MTDQVPDMITLGGRQWMITDEFEELQGIAPSDEQLGIRPVSTSTANWRGRTDHYIVFCERLFLHKVEVQQMVDDWKYLPPGSRREQRTIYPQWESHDGSGMRILERPEQSFYYVFDDLFIPFSGTVTGAWPYWNWWDFPMAGQYDFEELLSPKEELFLEFLEGELIDQEIRTLPDQRSDVFWEDLIELIRGLRGRRRTDV